MTAKLNTREFIHRSKAIHGDKYDYSNVKYERALSKVKIRCKKHDHIFEQVPAKHMAGQGCPKCKLETLSDKFSMGEEEFITKSKIVHGDKYGYSQVQYKNSKTHVSILCKVHNEVFTKTPDHFLSGQGCPKCSQKSVTDVQRKSIEAITSEASIVHRGKYSYDNLEVNSMREKGLITCPVHGDFLQNIGNHIHKEVGCPACNGSQQELRLIEFVKTLVPEVITGDRSLIKPLELDIVIPSKNIAIEYNGLYYHSEAVGKDRNYHLNKTNQCESKGYRLIHIFEDEWLKKKAIVENRLKQILGVTEDRTYARNLSMKELSFSEARDFLIETHIQGSTNSMSKAFGLFLDEALVACMTFGKIRFEDKEGVELLRFSSKGSVVGGFSKLLKGFVRSTGYSGVITSYSDKRWSQGGVYENNGFVKVGTSAPGYDYVLPDTTRVNRQHFMKHKLGEILKRFDPELTEVENCRMNNIHRIWNCGMDKWELKV